MGQLRGGVGGGYVSVKVSQDTYPSVHHRTTIRPSSLHLRNPGSNTF